MIGLLATGVQDSNVMSKSGLLPRVRSLFKALKQLRGPVLVSVVPVATEGCVEIYGQGCHREPCWSPRDMLLHGPCQSEWTDAMVISWPRQLLRTMSGSIRGPTTVVLS